MHAPYFIPLLPSITTELLGIKRKTWFLAIEGGQGLQEGTVDGRRVSLGLHSKAGGSLQGPSGFFH